MPKYIINYPLHLKSLAFDIPTYMNDTFCKITLVVQYKDMIAKSCMYS